LGRTSTTDPANSRPEPVIRIDDAGQLTPTVEVPGHEATFTTGNLL
jgi:hypothetical protein